MATWWSIPSPSRAATRSSATPRQSCRLPDVPRISSVLSQRQREILGLVVEGYVKDGRPVAARALSGRPEIDWSASTVRAELASLEEGGFLSHPHTAAGRVP